jgi:DNA-binding NarL/FixJ family response regulator
VSDALTSSGPAATCQIIIADDLELFRHGLRSLLESAGYGVVGEAASAAQTLELAERHPSSLLLLDLNLPGGDSFAVLHSLGSNGYRAHALVLSTFWDQEALFRAVSAGAHGYLAKDCQPAQLFAAIDLICHGGLAFGGAVADELRNGIAAVHEELGQRDRRRLGITDREYEILCVLPTSHSLAQIAGDLFISKKTVQNNVSSLYRKLEVNSRQEAVAKIIRLRLPVHPADD